MIFNGVLVYIFHEIFYGVIWDGEFIKLSYGMSMYIWCHFTLTVMVMREYTLHLLLRSVFINGSYLVCLCSGVCLENLLWKYLNFMKWSMWEGEGVIGVWLWGFLLCIGWQLVVLLDIDMMGVCKCV